MKRSELPHSSRCTHLEDKFSPTFRTQNNGFKNARVTQWRTWKHLFPVQLWADIVTILDLYPGSLDNTPVNTVWMEKHKTTITSQITTKSLRSVTITSQITTKSLRSVTISFREERLGLSHKELGTHSIRSCFSIDIFLARLYPKTIMIIGRWSINAFLC